MIYFALFIFGLALGSFLNVASLRYEPGQKLFDLKIIGGRSRCSHCRSQLSWYELVPLFSFFWQGGRCRKCNHPLSFQYPLVEFLSGLLLVLVPWYINFNFAYSSAFHSGFLMFDGAISLYQILFTAIWVIVFLFFLLLSVIDFLHFIIPDQANIALALLGVLMIVLIWSYSGFDRFASPFLGSYALLFGFRENILTNYILAALFGFVFFAAIIVLSRGRAMGWGDAKLIGAIGLIFGWPEIVLILILSFITGSIWSLPLLVRGRKSIKDPVPFGPFLVAGAAITFFFGYEIMALYFKLFS